MIFLDAKVFHKFRSYYQVRGDISVICKFLGKSFPIWIWITKVVLKNIFSQLKNNIIIMFDFKTKHSKQIVFFFKQIFVYC